MCEHGTDKLVTVKVPADLSSTGAEKWRKYGIDACIAPIVRALQAGGIDMRSSCCGHGRRDGEILLADGRVLVIRAPIVEIEASDRHSIENRQWLADIRRSYDPAASSL